VYKYRSEDFDSTVVALRIGDEEHGSFIDSHKISQLVGVILDKTNFYAESGGQVYDIGFITNDDMEFKVIEVKEYGGYILHCGYLVSGEISVGSKVSCNINIERRTPIMSNHTTTHVLNFALRKVIGNEIEQRGSLVTEDKFRFDFSIKRNIKDDELLAIEEIVNDLIRSELPVYTKEIPLEVALNINGVRAMFGEKYPDPVRVVSIGVDLDEVLKNFASDKWFNNSIEFCGGTHLSNTREAMKFAILEEYSLGSGIRRIVAVTGDRAFEAYSNCTKLMENLENLISVNDDLLSERYKSFNSHLLATPIPLYFKKQIIVKLNPFKERVVKIYKKKIKDSLGLATSIKEEIINKIKNENVNIVVQVLHIGGDKKVLGTIQNEILEACEGKDFALFLLSPNEIDDTIITTVCVGESLTQKLRSDDWVKHVISSGGKGGGNEKRAQGYYTPSEDLEKLVKVAYDFGLEKISK